MQITRTHIAYLHTYYLKLWLFALGIHIEHTSENASKIKLITDTIYPNQAGERNGMECLGPVIEDPELTQSKCPIKNKKHKFTMNIVYLMFILHGK